MRKSAIWASTTSRNPPASPGADHRDIDAGKRPGIFGQRIGQRGAADDVIVNVAPELAWRWGWTPRGAAAPATRLSGTPPASRFASSRVNASTAFWETFPVRSTSAAALRFLRRRRRRPWLRRCSPDAVPAGPSARCGGARVGRQRAGRAAAVFVQCCVGEDRHRLDTGTSNNLIAISNLRFQAWTSHISHRAALSSADPTVISSSLVMRSTSSGVVRPSRIKRQPSSRRLLIPCSHRHFANHPRAGAFQDQRPDFIGDRHHLENALPAAVAGALAVAAAAAAVQHVGHFVAELARSLSTSSCGASSLQSCRSGAPAAGPAPFPATRRPDTARSPCRSGASSRRGIVGVQRAEDQVAGQRRLHGDLGGLAVANFADQHHVRVVTQNRPQARPRTSGRTWCSPESG